MQKFPLVATPTRAVVLSPDLALIAMQRHHERAVLLTVQAGSVDDQQHYYLRYRMVESQTENHDIWKNDSHRFLE